MRLSLYFSTKKRHVFNGEDKTLQFLAWFQSIHQGRKNPIQWYLFIAPLMGKKAAQLKTIFCSAKSKNHGYEDSCVYTDTLYKYTTDHFSLPDALFTALDSNFAHEDYHPLVMHGTSHFMHEPSKSWIKVEGPPVSYEDGKNCQMTHAMNFSNFSYIGPFYYLFYGCSRSIWNLLCLEWGLIESVWHKFHILNSRYWKLFGL